MLLMFIMKVNLQKPNPIIKALLKLLMTEK